MGIASHLLLRGEQGLRSFVGNQPHTFETIKRRGGIIDMCFFLLVVNFFAAMAALCNRGSKERGASPDPQGIKATR